MNKAFSEQSTFIRQRSKEIVAELGLLFNPHLPLIMEDKYVKSSAEVCNRALVLLAVVAASYGFPKEKAWGWLASENLVGELTGEERLFLQAEKQGNVFRFQFQAECLWVLAWALGRYDSFNFLKPAPDDLVDHFPDIKRGESSHRWRNGAALISEYQLLPWLDLGYCIHWALREQGFSGQRSSRLAVHDQSIIERRRAMEWLLSGESWDQISLDT